MSPSANGCLGLYRVDMGPVRTGPSPHVHRTMSEAFFILSGALRLFDGDQLIDGTSGDFFIRHDSYFLRDEK